MKEKEKERGRDGDRKNRKRKNINEIKGNQIKQIVREEEMREKQKQSSKLQFN